MPSRDAIDYFGAGPAPLPTPVLEEASKVLLNYKDGGIGITEISHRSADANAILTHAISGIRQLLDIPSGDGPDGYQVLFLQGGGSGEFSATVYNLVAAWVGKKAKECGDDFERLQKEVAKMRLDYLVTGSWSLKASQEAARLVGSEHVNVACDARKHRDGKFGVIPSQDEWKITPEAENVAFSYYCDNETVDGVEFQKAPDGLPNLVGDMSSNFLSRRVDVRKHAAIFGGAQKNIGTTGITIAIISNKFLPPHTEYAKPDVLRKLGLPVGPVVLDWPTVAKNNSLYNTLPIFDVWIAAQVMQRLLDNGPSSGPKISNQQDESDRKAQLLYGVLDKHPKMYHVVPDKSVRSRMNLCFRVGDGATGYEATEKEFIKGAEAIGLLGLKGHRSVGGIRASNYNAVPVEAATKLAKYLQDFASKAG